MGENLIKILSFFLLCEKGECIMTLYDFFVQKEYQNAESILIKERKAMI
jgi:hypothetical protein